MYVIQLLAQPEKKTHIQNFRNARDKKILTGIWAKSFWLPSKLLLYNVLFTESICFSAFAVFSSMYAIFERSISPTTRKEYSKQPLLANKNR